VDILECVLAGGELAEHAVADSVCVRRWRVEVIEGLEYLAGVLRDGRGRGKDLREPFFISRRRLRPPRLPRLERSSPFTSTMSRE
jgi:hypothetical protein